MDKNLVSWGENPIEIFSEWLAEASEANPDNPRAMCLSTVDQAHRPHSRMVILHDVSKNGLTFYSNTQSPKALQIDVNPCVSLYFYWREIKKQVRIEGKAMVMNRQNVKDYFASRRKESQIATLVSNQSQILESREQLHADYNALLEKYEGGEKISCPDNWAEYCVVPTAIEFWSESDIRLHDRIVYEREAESDPWISRLLYP